MTATYLYCVIAAARRPTLTRVPRGLPGTGRVRLLDVDSGAPGLFAVVSDAPGARYSEAAINRGLADLDWVSRAAVAHEAVVEHFLGAKAVLPMKLFTIFAGDARALAYLRAERSRLAGLVRRVANHDEWGVRLVLNRDVAVRASPARSASRSATRRSGAAYLAGKKASRDASLELAARARTAAGVLYDRLAAKARLARRRTASELPEHGGSLILDAALLVARSRAASFRALAAKEARALAGHGYAVTLTGPWPPYTFVQD